MFDRISRFLALATLILLASGQARLIHFAVSHHDCSSGHAAVESATCPTDHPADDRPAPAPDESDHDCPICHHLASLGTFVSTSIETCLVEPAAQTIEDAVSTRSVVQVIPDRQPRAPPRLA